MGGLLAREFGLSSCYSSQLGLCSRMSNCPLIRYHSDPPCRFHRLVHNHNQGPRGLHLLRGPEPRRSMCNYCWEAELALCTHMP